MQLSQFPLRTRARLGNMEVSPEHRLRLYELGVRPGSEFFIVNKAAFGGLVVNIAGARVAVDRRSARAIEVEEIA
ncbi:MULTISPECIES: FeoA family protein [unclassified Actinomyces]|nr:MULTISPECIES: FeoA family protein [unclassified Actinomyces]MBF1731579.1 ferrous iron transport protein A [Trueperella pyogenes]MBF0943586.1 ferrous iron transport protein A [Actinomyces sp.]MBF0955241.1 ferrous iron transport protein A [Actinomyces sp.]MBF0963247.1 ferrous iron transport protein A [Actinomyces sp.]MBF0973861.1 ferrous iron transport protein A [Actinomyces sp.]